MNNFFRRVLIKMGKVMPFILAFLVAFGYTENLYSIIMERIIIDEYGFAYYQCSISNRIGTIVYIDWLDILLLYILALALELCKYNFRTVHYLLVNMFVRGISEYCYLDIRIVAAICVFMILYGVHCVYEGVKILITKQ